MLIVAAGFVFAVAAVLAYFRVSGAWPAMREVQFEVLPRYGATAFHWSFYFLFWALWHTQNHMGVWWEIMPALTLLIAWRRRELGRDCAPDLDGAGGIYFHRGAGTLSIPIISKPVIPSSPCSGPMSA